jgi:hypothetical protein
LHSVKNSPCGEVSPSEGDVLGAIGSL